MKKLFIILAVLVAIATPAIAQADTSTGTLNVQLTLAGTCGVQNTTLDFGLQVYNNSPIFGVGSVDVTCSPLTSYTVDLDGGLHSVGSPSLRRLYFNSGGAGPLAVDNFIPYSLYTDAARTHLWGFCCSGTSIAGFTGTGMTQHQPVYGLIAPHAMDGDAPGFYTDTVMVIVTF